MQITKLIPYGKENAISRKLLLALAQSEGLVSKGRKETSDWEMRRLITEARFSGTPVLYVPKIGGYYRPTEKEICELRTYIKAEEHRAKTILASLNSAKGVLADLENGAIKEVERN